MLKRLFASLFSVALAALTALATDRTLYCSQAQPSSMAASPQATPSSGRIDYLDLLLENIRKSGDLHW
jgi:hypothetical protein